MVATNATIGSGDWGSTEEGSRPLGHTRTERAPGANLSRSFSLTTTTWSKWPMVCLSMRRRAAASAR